MRLANVNGRLTLVGPTAGVGDSGGPWPGLDVERACDGLFGSDPQEAFKDWARFRAWASSWGKGLDGAAYHRNGPIVTVTPEALRAPVPRPQQVIAVGANYPAAGPSDSDRCTAGTLPFPRVFTKFPSCLTGPRSDVALVSDAIDWEIELVVVIGLSSHHVSRAAAWSRVAGLMVGQDLSEREVQMAGHDPQYSLGKSFPCFGPVGPVLVTPDELSNPDDIRLTCRVDGEVVQDASTRSMLLDVSELVSRLSGVITLFPGDLIFAGTPPGPGFTREPRRYLRSGEMLVSDADGIGRLANRMVRSAGQEAE